MVKELTNKEHVNKRLEIKKSILVLTHKIC